MIGDAEGGRQGRVEVHDQRSGLGCCGRRFGRRALAPGWRRLGPGRGAGAPRRTGIEIAARGELAVAAVHEGVVAYAAPFAGFGNLVIVDHGSQAFSLYGYLSQVGVQRGARVAHGQPVGVTGTSPTGAAALYFELRVDGRAVDPLQWLKWRP